LTVFHPSHGLSQVGPKFVSNGDGNRDKFEGGSIGVDLEQCTENPKPSTLKRKTPAGCGRLMTWDVTCWKRQLPRKDSNLE
tara:strand:- start:6657 stop:6899 length:243 start_codon:yes stop_codon:yes gene_type:complete